MTGRRFPFRSFAAALVSAMAVAGGANAQAPFYQGKTLVIYSGNSAGGAYSAYARLLEQHIAKHIPGRPATVVKFMEGAAGLTLANWLYTVAPKDGLAIGIFPQRLPIEPLVLPNGAARFEGDKFTWVGSLAKQSGVCITWRDSPTKTVQDARNRVTVVGTSGATSSDAVMPRIMNAMLGTQFKIVHGYGGADIFLAMERGEIEGRCGIGWASIKTTRPEWAEKGMVSVLTQFSLKSHPDLPGVPLMIDQVENPNERQALKLYFSPEEMGRPFAGPPGVPADRLAILREAFMHAASDPALLADAAKMKLEVDPISGSEVDGIVHDLYNAPPEIAKLMRSLDGESKEK